MRWPEPIRPYPRVRSPATIPRIRMRRFRPPAPLYAFSPDEVVRRQLALSWGVRTLPVEHYDSVDDMVWHAVERTVQAGAASPGDVVVVVAGSPESTDSASDVLRVVRVG